MVDHKTTPILSSSIKRAGTAVLLAAAFVLPACAEPTTDVETAEGEISEMADGNVTTEDINEALAMYEGQTVTVREEIEELVGDNSFLLEDDQLFGGEDILVINASGEGLELVEGDDTEVQVTGEVREFLIADLEEEYGFDLDPNLFVDYEQRPAIIAQSIALAPDPEEISEDPEQYYFRRIALNGEIESVLGDNIVTIDDDSLFGGDDLLVIDPEGNVLVQEGEEVTMTGTLRSFISADIERDYDLTWDLDVQEEIEAEYQDRPVFIVDEIYPSAV